MTVGDSLEGIPSVVFDFYSGMREQMMHLVRGHGYRRIAFIRGPEGHSEAEQRFRAYREVLSSCGIAFESSLVVSGDFLRDAGRRAVVALYDERRASFDAIAAVNDETALGALEELTRRGISVPHDVALTGFDDDDAVRWTTPQLTTVRFAIDAAARARVPRVAGRHRRRHFGWGDAAPSRTSDPRVVRLPSPRARRERSERDRERVGSRFVRSYRE